MSKALVILAGLCAVGCGSGNTQRAPVEPARDAASSSASSRALPDLSNAWQSRPLPSMAQPTAVRQGPAPLVYLVETGALIRVRDETDKTDLAQAHAPGRSIVRVDSRRGVIYGDRTLLPGPLPADHRYVIFVDPTGENVARQGVVQPRPRAAR